MTNVLPHVLVLAHVCCILATVGCSTPPTDLSGLARALTEVRAATNVGVAYGPFGDVVRKLAVEYELAVAAAGVPPSSVDAQTLRQAAEALDSYKDSLAAWGLKIRAGAILNDHDGELVKVLSERYKVPRNQHGAVQADAIIQAAWRDASIPSQAALALINTP